MLSVGRRYEFVDALAPQKPRSICLTHVDPGRVLLGSAISVCLAPLGGYFSNSAMSHLAIGA